MTDLRIAIGQINPRVGDFAGNEKQILTALAQAKKLGVDLLLFPELSVCGYPVEDLVLRGSFIKACQESMQKIARAARGKAPTLVVGGIESADAVYNAAAIIHDGKIRGWARKRHLFCCGRIDESRGFISGEQALVIETSEFRAAVTLGEDFGYPVFPAEVELLINLWNEPFISARRPLRGRMMTGRAREDAVAIAMVSPVGGQDDLIFEGSSKIVDGFGEILGRARPFREDLLVADLDLRLLKAHRARTFHSSKPDLHHLDRVTRVAIDRSWEPKRRPAAPPRIEPILKGPEELFTALALAVGDFVRKNGFDRVVLGLSGGIDSALTAVIAREALGADKVHAVSMPGPHTSAETRKDAKLLAKNLGLPFQEVPIKPAYQTMVKSLARPFEGRKPDLTEENLQARLRGVTLMAFANKLPALLLATGNKSEAAAGYCTLYGDTNGAFAPIVDLYKTQVYEIAKWVNRRAGHDLIPQSIIDRAPTAELRPGQKDQDSLPPYDQLDRVLHGLLEQNLSIAEVIDAGEKPEVVRETLRLLMGSEFKRRQVPLGPTVSERPLADLQFPVTKTLGWWNATPTKKTAAPRKKAKNSRKKS